MLLSLSTQSLTLPVALAVILIPTRTIPQGDRGDAVVICGSTLDQVKANVDACADERHLPQVRTRDVQGKG